MNDAQLADQVAATMKRKLEADWPEIDRRLRVAEAAELLRMHAPGRALEVLESILAGYEAEQNPATPDDHGN